MVLFNTRGKTKRSIAQRERERLDTSLGTYEARPKLLACGANDNHF